ncbi:NUDIX hydrolase [Candidatus Woesearchaeota archaeon]|nr:NUDIX hydrolase [Candidatus Woesearchaeota archaeon]
MAELDKNQFYIAVDAVVFTILHNQLKLLLIKRKNEPFKGKFALPGGFVERDENLEDAAKRELEEETGVKNIFLKKMHAFGDVGRDPRGRVISIPFLALIDAEELKLHATDDAELAKWGSVDSLPKHELAFDHKEIIKEALGLLRFELKETNIAFEIMPKRFTLTELQRAYEIILDKQLDKRNFRKQIFELSLLKEHSETKMEGAHRPAKLFSFKEKQYKML